MCANRFPSEFMTFLNGLTCDWCSLCYEMQNIGFTCLTSCSVVSADNRTYHFQAEDEQEFVMWVFIKNFKKSHLVIWVFDQLFIQIQLKKIFNWSKNPEFFLTQEPFYLLNKTTITRISSTFSSTLLNFTFNYCCSLKIIHSAE